MCQYIIKDLIERTKKGQYLGLPASPETPTYAYA
jgi:hypothetical protein